MGKEKKGIYGGSKIEESSRRGGGSGHGGGQEGNNGGASTSPITQGGSALIPVYAAGANDRRHQSHRGSNNGHLHKIHFPTLLIITIIIYLFLFVDIER
ncbi:hypothetical protein G2W53_032501 [Senna tora]|uniref:Uncharacterized protein n=1 Tax=Senna tora TaxID=362788 RepID=A0A834SWH4_9FABA|nr:hypothetical protein G2W53_032501 [Senna tora]